MSGLYNNARQLYLNGGLSWTNDTVRCVMLRDTHVPSLAQHKFLSDVQADAVSTSVPVSGKTSFAGVAGADPTLFPAVTGSRVGSLAVYKDTGNPATSPLIAFLDNVIGLPYSPTGVDVKIAWLNGTVFTL